MKKAMYLLIFTFFISSCALDLIDDKFFEKSDNIKRHSEKEISRKDYSKIDTLNYILHEQEVYIDSLNHIIGNLNDQLDSLQIQLDYTKKRVIVNAEFVIPDSIFFAGRKFDLTQERLRHKFIEIYKRELKWAHIYIPRSGKYFPLFEDILAEENIPDDTKYLAIAESGLNSLAGSKVGARGLWQFMPKTAKGYGMKINDFIDERLHPVVSTKTACKYLHNAKKYLNNRDIDDWLLTMASYNAGVGSISKVCRTQKSNNFFDLVLRVDETNKYVWRAVAIKMIFENEKEIFEEKFIREKPFYEQYKEVDLVLNGHYKIDEWVSAQGSSIGKIWELNHWIKIFKRKRRRYSALNDVVLSPGRFTVIFPKDSKPNSQKITFLEKEFKKKNSGYFLYHIVKRGDSLWKIASRYKTSVSKIKALNNLSSNVIRPGQKLRLKGKVPRKSKTYIVRSGDTLWDIANKHKTSIKKLMKINSLHSSNIRPGQKLRIY